FGNRTCGVVSRTREPGSRAAKEAARVHWTGSGAAGIRARRAHEAPGAQHRPPGGRSGAEDRMKASTKETTTTQTAPEKAGIHPEHREAAERLVARGRQQGYITQEDLVRALPDAEPGEVEELLLTLDDNNVEILEADRSPTWAQVKEEEEEAEELQREDSIASVLASDLISVDDPV